MENQNNIDCDFHDDDEIFFGRLTLKEVKKRIFMDVDQHSTALASCNDKKYDEIKIIETCSEPSILSTVNRDELVVEHLKSTSDPYFNRNKELVELTRTVTPDFESQSFLELEEKVTEQYKTLYDCDNTLDLVKSVKEKKQIPNNMIQDSDDIDKISTDDETSMDNISECITNNNGKSCEGHNNIEKSINEQSHIECDEINISVMNSPTFGNISNTKPSDRIILVGDDINKCYSKDDGPHKDECLPEFTTNNNRKLYEKHDNVQTLENEKTPNKCDKFKNISNTKSSDSIILVCDDINKSHSKDDGPRKDECLPEFTTNNNRKLCEKHDNVQTIENEKTPNKCDKFKNLSRINYQTPASASKTPINNKKEMLKLFKTPTISMSVKKDSSAKKTPRSKLYEHIASPIATYIRNCPQAPLMKNVRPKKPLSNISLIPKLTKATPEVKSNKENIMLPQIAYQNPKQTVVIDVDTKKLPKSNWAEKLTNVPQKPVVLRHVHRVAGNTPSSARQQQEDSFADLPVHQAEVSICTQKLAFGKL